MKTIITIDKKDPRPKYFQIKEQFQQEIEIGKLEPFDRLPSETEVAERCNISRMTVRQAFTELEKDGLIFREHGKGTFVKEPKPEKKQVKLISLLFPDIEYFIHEVIKGIESFAYEKGYAVTLCNTEASQGKIENYLSMHGEDNVAGAIICLPENASLKQVEILTKAKIPFVIIDYCPRGAQADYIIFDNVVGAYKAVTRLIKLGHKRIAYIGRSIDHFTNKERLGGYKKALIEHGIKVEEELVIGIEELVWLVDSQEEQVEKGRWENKVKDEENFRKLLFQKGFPTAIFTFDDVYARAIFNFTKKLGLRIPEDIALVGYDNTEVAKSLEVPLTSVAPPKYELGRKAAEVLTKKVENRREGYVHIILKPELVIRSSCGARIRTGR